MSHPESLPPSAWVERWAPLIPRGGKVLDVACGEGRHARYLSRLGYEVTGVDRDTHVIEGVRFVRADLEDGSPWPFRGQRFAGIVVTNYLHRPLFPALEAGLEEDGVLIYEIFMAGNERYGRPSNPAFLLRAAELLQAFRALSTLGFEQGLVERPKMAVVQRLCAIRGAVESAKMPPHDYR
jgi:SAM-dependent methyltransferase